jgi:hypothetical protein
MATDLPEEYETSSHTIAFKGEHEKWHQWKIKNKAIGMKKRWVKALETDYSCEGWSTLALTDNQKSQEKKNDDAWNFLVMACENKPFDLITCEIESNAFKGLTGNTRRETLR